MAAPARSVDEYISTRSEATRVILQRVRRAIRNAIPHAAETISYQIPAYKLHGRCVVYFAGWKQHYSVYPATERLRAAFEKELAGYEMSKGTIRFPLSEPVPVRLIGRIAKFLAEEAAERVAVKTAARKSARRQRGVR